MYTIKCNVSGLDGKDSKARLKNELERVSGVREVGINLTTGTVEIGYDRPASEDQIKSCIEEAGHRIIYE